MMFFKLGICVRLELESFDFFRSDKDGSSFWAANGSTGSQAINLLLSIAKRTKRVQDLPSFKLPRGFINDISHDAANTNINTNTYTNTLTLISFLSADESLEVWLLDD